MDVTSSPTQMAVGRGDATERLTRGTVVGNVLLNLDETLMKR